MLNSLENICKKILSIDESVPVTDIVDFLKKNKIYNPKSLFLINFKGKRVMSLKSKSAVGLFFHEILGFKKMYDENDDHYYYIYCRIRNGPKYLGYRKYFTNKKLTRRIDLRCHEKIDLGISIFLKTGKYHYNEFFVTRQLKKCPRTGIEYREIDFPFDF